jgi:hypothetical protein
VNSFNVIQEKTLNSKFLHYSIADTPNDSKNDNYQQSTTASELNPVSLAHLYYRVAYLRGRGCLRAETSTVLAISVFFFIIN